ncbi:AbrB/MazE/SpoVT family DNA-binding domain-containing protein [Oceanobacillus locisalsi]|uniref:AbrB/MazE/SpoVT family DNA-binding domain-containing protein n=1 Tax=Oceanobacillus locisalsi TaxID=546107 RepID=A0ABW3NAP0_9BACI
MVKTLQKEETMKPEKLTLKKRGQITIPKSIRDSLDLHEDDQLEAVIEDGKIVIQPVITIAKDQTWFWSPEWQQEEREADEDIKHGRVKTFDNADDAIAYLRDDED